MDSESRKKIEALYAEHVSPRADGGKDLSIDDHIATFAKAAKLGIADRKLADALGVPIEYVLSVKAAIDSNTH